MKILFNLKVLIIILLGCVFMGGAVNAKMSANFPIADTDKSEIAIFGATDGNNYLVPVITSPPPPPPPSPPLTPPPQPEIPLPPPPPSWSLYAQFVSKNGTLVQKIPILENVQTTISDAKVAYGGGKYLVIWTETGPAPANDAVKGVFINPNGTMGDIFTIVSGIPSEWNTVPDIAFGGGKFLVAYEKPYTYQSQTHLAIYGKLIDLDGNISSEFKISDLWGGFNNQHIAFDDTNFLVVYRDDKEDRKVLARRVSTSSGGPVEGELIIDNNNLKSDNPLAVFFDGEKYLVVWTDQTQEYPSIWQFYGKFVYPNGNQTIPFTITTVNSWKLVPFIAFDGSKYLITWNDARMCGFSSEDESVTIDCIRTGMDIYGRYFSKNGVALGGEFLVSGLPKNDVGGFMGKALDGKVLGIINKGFNLVPDSPVISAEDVDGRFWISSGYDIFAPDNKEKVMAGGNYTIRWRTPAQAVKFDISYSNDNKATWTSIKTGHTSKTLNWPVPLQDGRKPNSFIKIAAYDKDGKRLTTFYSSPFSIEVAKITQPNGGELLFAGQPYIIKWQTQGLNKTVSKTILQFSNNGINWYNIATLNGNPGEGVWKVVPSFPKPTYLIRVIFRDADGKNIAITESEAVFTVMWPVMLPPLPQ